MYTFTVQLVDALATGHIYFFMLFFVYVWLRWMVVNGMALRYRPFTAKHTAKTSVIIPVVDEPEGVFREVLSSITKQRPYQVIVVINGPKNKTLEKIARKYKKVQVLWTPVAGKRNAVRLGLEKAAGEIIALVDSDTIWTKDTLKELVKPFADGEVGGVTTRQKIMQPNRNLITRFSSLMEEIRAEGSMKAMSATGKVGCLPGRTIAFRKSILDGTIDEFMTERFMGVHKEVSDDRSLTNLTLKAGYKTVMQDTSLVYTDAPTSWRKFIRQQLRWGEGSQYNNLKMFGWMVRRAPLMLFIYVTDMLTPIFLLGVVVSYAVQLFSGGSVLVMPFGDNIFLLVLFAILGAAVSVGIRQLYAMRLQPIDILYLPVFVVIMTFIMVPVRVIGLARCADDLGWGTRKAAYKGGDAKQTANQEVVQHEA